MPLAPAIAASLSAGLPIRTRSLYVGGLDVVLKPTSSPGNAYGVLIESIDLTESGAGGVSSLRFTIDDPGLEVPFDEGAIVRLHNHARDWCEFLGFIQNWSIEPRGTGRRIDVIAQGIEAALDWRTVVGTIPAGIPGHDAFQLVYALSAGSTPPLWTGCNPLSSSDLPTPVTGWANVTQYAITFANPTTLREALRAVFASVVPTDPSFATYFLECSVDFYGGLRVWYSQGNLAAVSDTMTLVVDQASSPGEGLKYATDVGAAIRNVYITGGSAAGSGLVTDGTGLPGKTGTLSDPTSLTAVQRDAIGQAYLRENGGLRIRGSVVRSEPAFEAAISRTATPKAGGSEIDVTDAQATGGTLVHLRVTSIRRRYFPNGKCDWTISFGGNPPRATAHIRRLTASRLR